MIEIRQLHTREEFGQAVQLQKTIWGFEDIELLPVRLFVTAEKVGGHAFGAYDHNQMVGFCFAIPGIKNHGGEKQFYLHSHMLGVLPPYRNAGVGRMLKLAQRTEALSRGIELMEWTFDPLEIKNAYFNIMRLGAVVRRFVLNQYGTTSSKLHSGLPTDRCIAEWHLAGRRVQAVLDGREPQPFPEVARISITADIYKIRESNPAQAREIQKPASARFLELFSQGLAVTRFERTEECGSYIFTAFS